MGAHCTYTHRVACLALLGSLSLPLVKVALRCSSLHPIHTTTTTTTTPHPLKRHAHGPPYTPVSWPLGLSRSAAARFPACRVAALARGFFLYFLFLVHSPYHTWSWGGAFGLSMPL